MRTIFKRNNQALEFENQVLTRKFPDILAPARWYDFSDESTVTLNGNDISQVDDKSGNGINMIQPTASAQPSYETVDGLYTAHFNLEHVLYMTTELVDCRTVAIVSYEDVSDPKESWGTLLSPLDGSNGWHRNDDPDGWVPESNNYIYDDYWEPNNPNSARYGTTWLNNTNVGSGTTTRWPGDAFGVILTVPGGPLPIGLVGMDRGISSRHFNGKLGEYLAFDRVLNSQEIDLLNRYLMSKWRIS